MNQVKPDFTDGENRNWTLKLNVGLIEDIKEQTEIDLDLLVSNPEKLAAILYANPRKVVEMLWVLCQEQAETYGLNARQFGKLFDRDTLDKAADSFLVAMVNFYPRTSAGRTIRESLPRMIQKMDSQIEQKTKERIERVLSDTLTDLPES